MQRSSAHTTHRIACIYHTGCHPVCGTYMACEHWSITAHGMHVGTCSDWHAATCTALCRGHWPLHLAGPTGQASISLPQSYGHGGLKPGSQPTELQQQSRLLQVAAAASCFCYPDIANVKLQICIHSVAALVTLQLQLVHPFTGTTQAALGPPIIVGKTPQGVCT